MCRGNMLTRSLAATLLSLALQSEASAQTCFRGHPTPRCSGFTVLEFTMGGRLNQVTTAVSAYDPGATFYASWSAGYLQNVGPRWALGAAFKVVADDDGARYGPVLRYRRWLGPTWSLDLAPGLLIGGEKNYTTLRFPSATADIALNWGDRVAVLVGVDQLRDGSGTTGWEGHTGLRLGTWLAPLGMVALAIPAGATYN